MSAAAGARMTVAEALSNLVFARISELEVCMNYRKTKTNPFNIIKDLYLYKRMSSAVATGCGPPNCREKAQLFTTLAQPCAKS